MTRTKLFVFVFLLLAISLFVSCETDDFEDLLEDINSIAEMDSESANTLSTHPYFDPAYYLWFYGIPSSQHAAYQRYFKTQNTNNMDIAKLTPPTLVETTTTTLNNENSTTTVVKKELVFSDQNGSNLVNGDKSWAVYALEQRYMILSVGASIIILMFCLVISCSCIPVESELVKQEKLKQQKVTELLELNLEQQTIPQKSVETEYKQV